MTKLRIVLPVLIAVVTGTIISFSVAMAQENDIGDKSPGKFATKLAEILGLNPTIVDQAVQQARTEIRETSLQERLNKLVASEKLTKEQAEIKLKEFRSSKQSRYLPHHKPNFKSKRKPKLMGPKFKGRPSRLDIEKRIKSAVERGTLTEEQAKNKLQSLKQNIKRNEIK